MWKILKYSSFDLLRSRWTLFYLLFFLVFTSALLFLSGDLSKVVASLMNVVLILCPLIATMFGVMYYYNSHDFIELLLAQPLRRRSIFLGLFAGQAISLSLSLLLGIGIPFLLYGIFRSPVIGNFSVLIWNGIALTVIFSAMAYWIALRNENRIRGFAVAIGVWLFFAVIYDGLFLLALSLLRDYPLERFSLIVSLLNPIDLARVLLLLKMDISAIMGYTGAVFQQFLGNTLGMAIAFSVLLVWIGIPVWRIQAIAARKDF